MTASAIERTRKVIMFSRPAEVFLDFLDRPSPCAFVREEGQLISDVEGNRIA